MKHQPHQGFVLVTSLIFLIVLSLLGVMAMRGSLFEERMASNDRDLTLAREYAEMALRDAERDILGLRFDGTSCARASVVCNTERPAGTRPNPDNADDQTFWADLDVAGRISSESGGLGEAIERQGVYNLTSPTACGMPIWSGANWNDGNATRRCAGTIGAAVPTIPYGTFTDAPFNGPPGAVRPRYLIEVLRAADLGADSKKLFFRITAVGFGRTQGASGRTSVTLQSVFSPNRPSPPPP